LTKHDVLWTTEKIEAFRDFVSTNQAQAEMYFTRGAGAGVASHIARSVGLQGKSLLDFGCGPEYLYPHLARLAPSMRYFGLDYSQQAIDQLLRSSSGQPQFAGAGTIGSLPVQLEQQYDVIVAIEVIEHLDDENLEQSCLKFSQLLKKGGKLYLSTPNDENLLKQSMMCPDCGGVFHRWQHTRSWNSQSIVAQMTKFGFSEHRTYEMVYSNNRVRAELTTRARRILGRPCPSLCYVGTKV
jgi:2-polyprenyl-3-methyl-5-hydroxy-6-metoxy-1,4-benzoquinol methylase